MFTMCTMDSGCMSVGAAGWVCQHKKLIVCKSLTNGKCAVAYIVRGE